MKAIPFLALFAVFCAVTLLIHHNSDKLFVFFEERGWFCEPVEINIVEEKLTLTEVGISDLKQDERVVWDQSLMLINTQYLLGDGFVPAVAEYKSTDVYMNSCVLESYSLLSSAVSDRFGGKLYVSSDFRTYEEQKELYEDDPLTATIPGASEHQTGLAVDVYVAYYAGDAFIKSPAGRFVNAESHKYGFIIRYPSYGEEITEIRFEPWHLRYVGMPHADIIYHNQLTLEEYILSMEIGTWYEAEGYLICRQEAVDGCLSLPENFI